MIFMISRYGAVDDFILVNAEDFAMRKNITALVPSFLVLITTLVVVGIACSSTDPVEPATAIQPDGSVTTAPQGSPQLSDSADGAPSQSVEIPAYLLNAWRCVGDDSVEVEDYTTQGEDGLLCSVEVEYTDTAVVVRSTGIPNHDFESTLVVQHHSIEG